MASSKNRGAGESSTTLLSSSRSIYEADHHYAAAESSDTKAPITTVAPIVDVKIIESIKKAAPSSSGFGRNATATQTPNGKAAEIARRASMAVDRQADIAMALEQLRRPEKQVTNKSGSSLNNLIAVPVEEDQHPSGPEDKAISSLTTHENAHSSGTNSPSSFYTAAGMSAAHSRKSSMSSGSVAIARIRSSISAASSAPMSRHLFNATEATLEEDEMESSPPANRLHSHLEATDATVLSLQLADSQQQVVRMQEDLAHLQNQFRAENTSLREQNSVLNEEISRLKVCLQNADIGIHERDAELGRWIRECEHVKKYKADTDMENRLRLEEIEKQVAQVELEHVEVMDRQRQVMGQEQARVQAELERERERFQKLESEKDRMRKELDVARNNWLQKEADLEQRSVGLDKKLSEAFSAVETLRKDKENWKKEKSLIAERLREHKLEVDRVIKGEEQKSKKALEEYTADRESWENAKLAMAARLTEEQTVKRSLEEKIQSLEASVTQTVAQQAATWDAERQDLLSKMTELASQLRDSENVRRSITAERDQEVHRLQSQITSASDQVISIESEKQTLQAQLKDSLRGQVESEKQLHRLAAEMQQLEISLKQGEQKHSQESQTWSAERQDLLDSLQDTNMSLQVAKSQEEQFHAEKIRLLEEASVLQSEFDYTVQQLDDTVAQKNALTDQLAVQAETVKGQEETLRAQCESLKALDELPILREAIQSLEAQRTSTQATVRQLHDALEQSRIQEAHMQSRLASVLADIAKRTDELESANRIVVDLQGTVSGLRSDLDASAIRLTEISGLQKQVSDLQEQLKQLQDERQTLNMALESATSTGKEAEAQLQYMLAETRAEKNSILERVQATEEKLVNMEQAKSALEVALDTTRLAFDQEKQELLAQNGEMVQKLASSENTRADLGISLEAQRSASEQERNQLVAQLQTLSQAFEMLEKDLVTLETELQDKLKDHESERNDLERRIRDSDGKLSAIESDKAALQGELHALQQTFEQEREAATDSHAKVQAERNQLADQLQILQASSAETAKETASRLQILAEQRSELESRLEHIQRTVVDVEERSSQWEISLQAANTKLEDCERQLREAQSTLVKKEEASALSLQELHNKLQSTSNFWSETKGVLAERDTEVVRLQSETAAQQQKIDRLRERIVELSASLNVQEQLVAETKDAIQQLQVQLNAVTLERDQAKASLEQLQAQEQQLNVQLTLLSQNKADLAEKVQEVSSRLNNRDKELSQAQYIVQQLEQQLREMTMALETARSDNRALETVRNELSQDKSGLAEKLQATLIQLDATTHELAQSKTTGQELERHVRETGSTLMIALETERAEKGSLQATMKALSKEKDRLESILQGLNSTVDQENARIQALQGQLSAAIADNDFAEEKIAQQTQQLNNLQAENASKERTLHEYKEAIKAQDATLQTQGATLQALSSTVDQANARIQTLEVQLTAATADNDAAKDKIGQQSQQLESLQVEKASMDRTLYEYQDAMKTRNGTVVELEGHVLKLQAQLQEATVVWNEASNALEAQRSKSFELEKTLALMVHAREVLENKLQSALENLAMDEKIGSESQTQIQQLHDQLAQMSTQWRETKARLELLQTKDAEMTKMMSSLLDEKTSLQQQLVDQRLASDMEQQQSAFDFGNTIVDLKEQLSTTRSALEAAQESLSAHERRQTTFQQDQQLLRSQLEQAQSQKVKQVKTLQEDSTREVRLLQDRYDDLQVEHKESERLLDDLKVNHSTLQEGCDHLEKRLESLQEQYAKVEVVKMSLEEQCHTLSETLIGRDKQIEESQLLWEKNKSSMEAHIQELETELQQQTQELSLVRGDVAEKLKSIGVEKESLELSEQSNRQEIQVLHTQVETAQSQVQAVQDANAQIQANLLQSDEKLQAMMVSHQQLQNDLQVLSSEKKKLDAQLEATQTFASSSEQQRKQDLDRIVQEKISLEEMLTSAQESKSQAAAVYQEQLDTLREEQKKTAVQQDQLQAIVNQLTEDVKLKQSQIDQLTEDLESKRSQISQLFEELDTERFQLQGSYKEKVILEEISTQHSAEARDRARLEVASQISQLQQELRELAENSVPTTKLHEDVQQLATQMREGYEQVITDLKQKHQMDLAMFYEMVSAKDDADGLLLLQDEVEVVRRETKRATDRIASELQEKYQSQMTQLESGLREQFSITQAKLTQELLSQKEDHERSMAMIRETQEAQLTSAQNSLHEQYAADLENIKQWYEAQMATVRKQVDGYNAADAILPDDVHVLRELLHKADEERYRLTRELDQVNAQFQHVIDQHPQSVGEQLRSLETREMQMQMREKQHAEAVANEEARWRAELDKLQETHLAKIEDILKHSEETRKSLEEAAAEKEKEIAFHLAHLETQIANREERIQTLNSDMQTRMADAQEAQKILSARIADLESSVRQQKVAYAMSTASVNQLTTENEELIHRHDTALQERDEFARILEATRRKYGETVDRPRSPNFVMDEVRRISSMISHDSSPTPQERTIHLAPSISPARSTAVLEEATLHSRSSTSANQTFSTPYRSSASRRRNRVEVALCDRCNLPAHTSDQCPDLMESWCDNCQVYGHRTDVCERADEVSMTDEL